MPAFPPSLPRTTTVSELRLGQARNPISRARTETDSSAMYS